MEATTKDAVLSAEPQPESVQSGEPTGSVENGESGTQAPDKERTAGEGLFDGMTQEQLHKSYKSVQGEYTKNQQLLKQFERFGGAEQVIQWANYLGQNPDFAQWWQGQQTKNALGIDESKLDPETKSAYDTVRKISEQIADTKLRQAIQQDIAPVADALKQQLLESNFKKMDEKYGAEWQELRDTMSELSEELPEKIQDRPSFDDIEDLYFKAMRKTGKFETYARKLHEKSLNVKKAKATGKPQTGGESQIQPSHSMQEAFAAAKRQHNI